MLLENGADRLFLLAVILLSLCPSELRSKNRDKSPTIAATPRIRRRRRKEKDESSRATKSPDHLHCMVWNSLRGGGKRARFSKDAVQKWSTRKDINWTWAGPNKMGMLAEGYREPILTTGQYSRRVVEMDDMRFGARNRTKEFDEEEDAESGERKMEDELEGRGYMVTTVAGGSAYPLQKMQLKVMLEQGDEGLMRGFTGRHEDGFGEDVCFHDPLDVAADKYGNVYVADSQNHVIRKILPGGNVTTYGGIRRMRHKVSGYLDGPPKRTFFNTPIALDCDPEGNLVVSDLRNNVIRMVLAPYRHDPELEDPRPPPPCPLIPEWCKLDGNYLAPRFNWYPRLNSQPVSSTVCGYKTHHPINLFDDTIPLDDRQRIGTPTWATEVSFPDGVAIEPTTKDIYFTRQGPCIHRITRRPSFFLLKPRRTSDKKINVDTNQKEEAAGKSAPPVRNGVVSFSEYECIVKRGGITLWLQAMDGIEKLHEIYKDIRIEVVAEGAKKKNLKGNKKISLLPYILKAQNEHRRSSSPSKGHLPYLLIDMAVYDTDNNTAILNKEEEEEEYKLVRIFGARQHGVRIVTYDVPEEVITAVDSSDDDDDYDNEAEKQARASARVAASSNAASNSSSSSTKQAKNTGRNNECRQRTLSSTRHRSAAMKGRRDWTVEIFAGDGKMGVRDGYGHKARFVDPGGLACDTRRNIYIADRIAGNIRKISPDRTVTTLAGTSISEKEVEEAEFLHGLRDGPASQALFYCPNGLCVSRQGNVYIADSFNHRIRKISLKNQEVTTLAGGFKGFHDMFHFKEFDRSYEFQTFGIDGAKCDGKAEYAAFKEPTGVAVDLNETVYVADSENQRICKIIPIPRSQWSKMTERVSGEEGEDIASATAADGIDADFGMGGLLPEEDGVEDRGQSDDATAGEGRPEQEDDEEEEGEKGPLHDDTNVIATLHQEDNEEMEDKEDDQTFSDSILKGGSLTVSTQATRGLSQLDKRQQEDAKEDVRKKELDFDFPDDEGEDKSVARMKIIGEMVDSTMPAPQGSERNSALF